MIEVNEAKKITLFNIDGQDGVFRKVSSVVAAGNQDVAVKALFGSTISWFLPYDIKTVKNAGQSK